MPRPKKERMISSPPLFSEFKPSGAVGRMLGETELSLDEYEAVNLVDYQGFEHTEAAEEMGISRPTVSRLLESGRKKLAEFIIKGNKLLIAGGNVHFKKNILKCLDCGHMFNIDISKEVSSCPNCGSEQLVNIAAGFGHGKCCRGFKKHNKRGGKYAKI